ncbi:NADPH:quinone oxidoreductase family protein [Methylovirgula sp. 4M-Z18]|uniref:NADPH:quinone oxidoreductase family protein n=1 Tax=Methylovirgula sp. 4M-Z18 TaxID=2293567 RepID=UPI000E2ED434|nr:NADPH:quinone oxidoreductase family protein [Methylovirgula sp. 4M-Z18]RFB78530.1 NADPH:quinone oxidoreductase family protein [Methylovirgula sp. 4M-Z18]
MKAVLCRAYGPPENLVVETLNDPIAGPGEIVVETTYIGLNFFDTLIIENKYQIKPPLPFSPGAEFAGRIGEIGADVTGFQIGDRVMGFIGYGACRSKVLCKAADLIHIPEGLSDEQAAGLTVTYGTALHSLKQRAQMRPGETLAVLGASGGVGIAAVEIGRLMGAKVIACASNEEKLAFAVQHGASERVDYGHQDLKEALRTLTGGNGVDVIYDPVGGQLSEAALRSIAWQGRFLVVGFASGEIPKVPLNLALLKGCDVLGVSWGEFVKRSPQGHRENMAQLAAWAATRTLSAHVHAVYPMEQIATALGVIRRREANGKVVIKA